MVSLHFHRFVKDANDLNGPGGFDAGAYAALEIRATIDSLDAIV